MGWDDAIKINSDLMNVPLNILLYIQDYKMYGDNSYVFRNNDTLKELCSYPSITMVDDKLRLPILDKICEFATSDEPIIEAIGYFSGELARCKTHTSLNSLYSDETLVYKVLGNLPLRLILNYDSRFSFTKAMYPSLISKTYGNKLFLKAVLKGYSYPEGNSIMTTALYIYPQVANLMCEDKDLFDRFLANRQSSQHEFNNLAQINLRTVELTAQSISNLIKWGYFPDLIYYFKSNREGLKKLYNAVATSPLFTRVVSETIQNSKSYNETSSYNRNNSVLFGIISRTDYATNGNSFDLGFFNFRAKYSSISNEKITTKLLPYGANNIADNVNYCMPIGTNEYPTSYGYYDGNTRFYVEIYKIK